MTTLDLTRTAPWSSDTHNLLTRTMSHIVRPTVVLPSGEQFAATLEGGRVAFDETRAPRVQASLTCRVPTDQALLDRLDPRTGARLVIDAGYRRPDGLEDVQPLVDLGLRSRRVARPNDTMTLEGASDEALVIDNSASVGGSVVEINTQNGIANTIREIFPGLTFDTTGAPGGAALNQSPMGNKWTLVMDLADRIGAQVYDNGLRSWFIRPMPVLTTPALGVAVGVNGTILGSDAGLDRDEDWGNRVLLTYKWTDSSNVAHQVYGVRSITSGVYAAVTGNTRVVEVDREIPATQTEANAAAASLVARTVTRGRSFSLQAISAYWLRPGHTIEVTLPLGDPEQHLVTGVEFDLGEGTMRVTTRLPDNTGTIGA